MVIRGFSNPATGISLASMQWRRGILFAAVHLAVVLPMVAVMEVNEAAELRLMRDQNPQEADPPTKAPIPASEASGEIMTFNLCSVTDVYSPNEKILVIADPAPVLVTQWRYPCPPQWSVAGMLVGTVWSRPSFTQFAKEQKVDAIFLLLIGIQWTLIGSFPLRPHRGLWGDPATHITFCTVVAGALSFVPNIESFSTLPMFYALAAWVWWLSLIVAKLFRSMLGFAKSWRLGHAK